MWPHDRILNQWFEEVRRRHKAERENPGSDQPRLVPNALLPEELR